MNLIKEMDIRSWTPKLTRAQTNEAIEALEHGFALCLPNLSFKLTETEKKFLSPQWSDQKSKNISLRPQGGLRGAVGSQADQDALQAMIARYADQATSLVSKLFPEYMANLTVANTSFRPVEVDGRVSSYRKDDKRLHTDAFPSNPTQGTRLLRVFNNVNPHGKPRVWRVGEPFETMAIKFLPQAKPLLPGQAWLMNKLGITKQMRTPYDQLMLELHDLVKADMDYQLNAPQQTVHFMPGTTWIVFSDQVLHAVMSGQYMMEQTFHLPVGGLYHPETAPLKVLERLTGRNLLA
jgi:3-deoxy-D-manno-oct-2-ulosonic acid (Kdo) hydroxylase